MKPFVKTDKMGVVDGYYQFGGARTVEAYFFQHSRFPHARFPSWLMKTHEAFGFFPTAEHARGRIALLSSRCGWFCSARPASGRAPRPHSSPRRLGKPLTRSIPSAGWNAAGSWWRGRMKVFEKGMIQQPDSDIFTKDVLLLDAESSSPRQGFGSHRRIFLRWYRTTSPPFSRFRVSHRFCQACIP